MKDMYHNTTCYSNKNMKRVIPQNCAKLRRKNRTEKLIKFASIAEDAVCICGSFCLLYLSLHALVESSRTL